MDRLADDSLRRHAIGIIAACLLLAAGMLRLWQPEADLGESGMAGIFIRTGIVCGAMWLAWPQIGRIHPWILMGAAACLLGLLYVARQPRTLVLAAAIALLVFKLRPPAPAARGRR